MLQAAATTAAACEGISMMKCLRVASEGLTRPFGDERTVKQAFPTGVPSSESDPFLMCDFFSMPSDGASVDPDHFPVNWHPHRGMDILSYLKTGIGRHGDSMGNRENFATPGMQWISCGSGIEHAEGGATPAGESMTGFQIWINVPAARKMDDPKYGTEPPESIPQEQVNPGAKARLLSGALRDRTGAMKAQCDIQMIDFELDPSSSVTHVLPTGLDTCMLYCYGGSGKVAGQSVPQGGIALLDATNDGERGFEFVAGAAGAQFMLFAGKKLKEPIAWHGPIVMNTDAEIRQCFGELQSGTFPPKRVPWNYKVIATKPPT
jgi:redox-sensitive bicupin YhaK (pirin superfamily)